MISYLMTSVTYACNFLHEWVRIILYNEGGEEILGFFLMKLMGKSLEAIIGS
jgi:hypothetical protein